MYQKFKHDPQLLAEYKAFISKIILNGDAEVIPPGDLSKEQDCWYIPHFGVYHPKKPGNTRVVFDVNAKCGGVSLNDHLLQGPDLMNSLLGGLLRFRRERFAIACDIQQMFHQFKVHPEDRDYLRFLWYDKSGRPVDYRMTVHIFGAVSSPGCAPYGLQHIAQTEQNVTSAASLQASQFIQRDFYVDDGLISVPNTEEGISVIKQAVAICKKGSLRLHKFAANVLRAIPETEHAELSPSFDFSTGSVPIQRALGVEWIIENDSFKFRIEMKDQQWTRSVLATVAPIFNPLGLVTLLVLAGKQILQQMRRDVMSWDDPLPKSLPARWERWRHDVQDLQDLKVSRCLIPVDFGAVESQDLHHFSDASDTGYGQFSFSRSVNQSGCVYCALTCAKARVIPKKGVITLRAELQAAVLSAKIARCLKEMGLQEMKECL